MSSCPPTDNSRLEEVSGLLTRHRGHELGVALGLPHLVQQKLHRLHRFGERDRVEVDQGERW